MCTIYHMISHENAGKVHLTKPICAMNEDWHGLVRYLVPGLMRTVFYRGSRVDGYPTWQWRRSTDSLDHAHCRHNIYVALSEWVSLLRLYDKNNDDDLIIIKSNSSWRIANMTKVRDSHLKGQKGPAETGKPGGGNLFTMEIHHCNQITVKQDKWY